MSTAVRIQRLVECDVQIEVDATAPLDWLSRVTVPDEFPYWNDDGAPFTEEQGLRMLVDNAVRNGAEDACVLDGWGDLARGMVTMQVQNVRVSP